MHHAITGFVRLAAASLLLAVSLPGIVAQANPDLEGAAFPADRLETHLKRMTDRLALTETQQTAIRQILENDRAQRDLQRQARRDQIDGVLTGEQKAKRETLLKASQERRLARMTKRLNLSGGQTAQIQAVFDAQRTDPQLTRTEAQAQIFAVLTAEQRVTMQERPRRADR